MIAGGLGPVLFLVCPLQRTGVLGLRGESTCVGGVKGSGAKVGGVGEGSGAKVGTPRPPWERAPAVPPECVDRLGLFGGGCVSQRGLEPSFSSERAPVGQGGESGVGPGELAMRGGACRVSQKYNSGPWFPGRGPRRGDNGSCQSSRKSAHQHVTNRNSGTNFIILGDPIY